MESAAQDEELKQILKREDPSSMSSETESPTVSIVTAVYNNRETIADTIQSVKRQSYPNIEYIIQDGGSDDGTHRVIEQNRSAVDQFVVEEDEGIYDAFNRGVRRTTGDIVGILNADDFYNHRHAIRRIVEVMEEVGAEAAYADLVYVEPDRTEDIVRYWRAGKYDRGRFCRGWMPPHPTFFVRRSLYEKYGGFEPELDIAADYELMFRFLYRYHASAVYLPEVLVRMRAGGHSNASLQQRFRAHIQDYRAWLKNGEIPFPWRLIQKPLRKLRQFVAKPQRSPPTIPAVED